MKVELRNVTKAFPSRNKKSGEEVIAVNDCSFTIPDGKLIGLLGPSGCGKSTTLYMICGLQKPTKGQIFFGEDDVTGLAPENRGVGLVFQNYALYPHLTVKQNILFPLQNLKGADKLSKEEMLKRAYETAKLVQIDELMDRKPSELSGGQQQRVAIARAIASSPKLLLLDEPLSNLDARLRIDMRAELKRLHRETGTTIIYVTHDQVEALTMSTKIALFKEGEISQIGTPLDLYTNPIDLQAADFIGNPRINFIEAKGCFDGETLRVKSAFGEYAYPKRTIKLDEEIPADREFDCVLGLRPEMVDIYAEDPHHNNTVHAQVYANQPAGSETLVSLTVGDTEFLAIQVGLVEYDMNQNVYVVLHPGRMNVYNKETGRLIKYAKTKHKAGAED